MRTRTRTSRQPPLAHRLRARPTSAYRRVIVSIEPVYDEPFPPTDAAAELHTTLDAARLGLARLMEAAGRPAEALELYRKWTAWTGCGNCSASANAQGSLHEARVYSL